MCVWACQFRSPLILKSKPMNGNFSFPGGTEVTRAGIYPKPIIPRLSEVAKWWPEDSIWPACVCHWPTQCFSFNWINPQHSKFKKFHIKNPDFQIFLEKTEIWEHQAHTLPKSLLLPGGQGRGGLSLELTMLGLSTHGFRLVLQACHPTFWGYKGEKNFRKHLWKDNVHQRTWEEQK